MCTGINNFLKHILFSCCTDNVLRYMLMNAWWRTVGMITFPDLVYFLYLIFGPSTTILGMAGPVIWTINLSHTPLVCGWLWNTTMMLLKSDRAAGEEKQWGCGLLFFFFCALWVCIYMCEWSEFGLSVCLCVYFFFLASMCIVDLLFQRGYYAFML